MAEFSVARVFVMEDQENFARISGDYNPIHMDPSAARHTQAGAPVVHGMHLLLWALENLLGDGMDLARLSWGKVKFTSFVLLGKAATLKIIERNEKEIRVAVRCGDATAMIVRLGLGGDPVQRTAFPAGKMKIPLEPEDPELADLKGRTGNLVANSGTELLCETMFPEASRTLSTGAVRDFALMSTLIGMLIPGLNSILSEISFRVMEEELPDPTLIFAVSQVDERFRLVTLKAEGARISARLVAFMRLPVPLAPNVQHARSFVSPGEFRDRRALIIGGSRGLGAAASVLLAAGGASIILTYCNDGDDARKLAREIQENCGRNSCAVFKYDAGIDAGAQICAVAPGFTHLYYFATPRIFAGGDSVYARTRLGEFLSIYVDGFADLVKVVMRAQYPAPLTVLYPSSIAVAQRPLGMTEYAMAKAAGEILCADLARAFPDLTITSPRLERTATMQTATVPPVQAADPIEVMLPLLRNQRTVPDPARPNTRPPAERHSRFVSRGLADVQLHAAGNAVSRAS